MFIESAIICNFRFNFFQDVINVCFKSIYWFIIRFARDKSPHHYQNHQNAQKSVQKIIQFAVLRETLLKWTKRFEVVIFGNYEAKYPKKSL